MASSEHAPPPTNLAVLLQRLAEARIEFVVVGGVAAVTQGAPWTTSDLDIVQRQTPGNISRLLEVCASLNAYFRRPDRKHIMPREKDLTADGHVLLVTDLGPLDLLGQIEGGRRYDQLLPLSIDVAFRGHSVRVLGLRHLIEIKGESNHPKDQRMLPILREVLRQIESDDEPGPP